ncbi:MAG: chemotaxis protein CheB [Terriglobia bacterium]
MKKASSRFKKKVKTRHGAARAEGSHPLATEQANPAAGSTPFPIVGIGASAGGLEAFTRLLDHLPATTGMAFVLIQHLSPTHESSLTELLSRKAKMPVTEVTDGMVVKRDHVYVIPPNVRMMIRDGRLRLFQRDPSSAMAPLPVDFFFQSLAVERAGKAIGVILSGTGSDGTQGLQAIKEGNGITFAQDERSAKYGGMPHSAIGAGCVDFVLTPEDIAKELLTVASHPYVARREAARANEVQPEDGSELKAIFRLLARETGVDFNLYKRSTVKRRIERRIILHKLENVPDYIRYLQEHPEEINALFQDILIHVTSFFRDPQAFEALTRQCFPRLMKGWKDEQVVRIWVPGCSTGQEVYSVAICLMEYLHAKPFHPAVQIFGTDVNPAALQKARAGLYTESDVGKLSPRRLKRFFVKVENGYQISKAIREMCIFSVQSVITDPPFARLDLISCRNLLIYLEPALQKKVIPVFHYALKPKGFLMLGSSETVGGAFAELFNLVDRKRKIYARRPVKTQRPFVPLSPAYEYAAKESRAGQRAEVPATHFDLEKNVDAMLLSRCLPAVVVDKQMQVLEFRGNTAPYLEMASGKASLHLGKLVQEGLMMHLRAAIHQAGEENVPVRKDRIQFKSNDAPRGANLEVIPIKGAAPGETYFLVLFQEAAPSPASEPAAPLGKPGKPPSRGMKSLGALERESARLGRHNTQLKQELAQTRANLLSIIEEQEATNEEVRASNEEILSSNEELQSINEELETAKEELQSSNEELATLNEELHNRNLELDLANTDRINLLANFKVPVLVLSKEMRIRHFTPAAAEIFDLSAGDTGRPVGHLKNNFGVPNLEELIHDSVTHAIKEQEVQDRQGRWYSLRIRPYKMPDNKVGGSVLTWVDVETLKRSLQKTEKNLGAAEASLRQSEDRYRLLFERNLAGVYFAAPDGRALECNQAFAQILGYASPREVMDVGPSQLYFDAAQWQALITQLRQRRAVTNFDCRFRRKDGAPAEVLMNCILAKAEGDAGEVIESIVMDITSRMQAEASVTKLSARVMQLRDEERRKISRELHDTVGSGLTALLANLSLLKKSGGMGKQAQKHLSESLGLVKECSREIRTISYLLHPPLLEEAGLASAIRWYANGFAERSGIKVSLDIPPEPSGSGRLPPNVATAFFRIVQESLTNIHLHSGSRTASVRIRRDHKAMTLEVRDKGRGIPAEVLGDGGRPMKLGVGISSMRERMKQLGGEINISSGSKGTAIQASLPLGNAGEA